MSDGFEPHGTIASWDYPLGDGMHEHGVGGGVPGVVGGPEGREGLYRYPPRTIPGTLNIVYSRLKALPTAK